MNREIRDAGSDDAADLAVLLAEFGYPTTAERVVERVKVFTEDPGSRLLVAVAGGQIVGLVATHLVPRLEADAPSCRVTDLVVAESRRGEGHGKALIAAAESEAVGRGASRLDLSSGNSRGDAHAFYERLGFSSDSQAFRRELDGAR